MPGIDWDKLGEDNSSLFDILYESKLDEALKRHVEVEVHEVSARNCPGQETLEMCLAGLTEEIRFGTVKTGGRSSQRCTQAP